MRCRVIVVLAALAPALGGCSRGPRSVPLPDGAEMLFWEAQSWMTAGPSSRLTIWADGRSQIIQKPVAASDRPYQLPGQRARPGWEWREDVGYVKEGVLPPEAARACFENAFKAGIHLLETFKPWGPDGQGIVVGVQIKGVLRTTIIPEFSPEQKQSANCRRFNAVKEALPDFEWIRRGHVATDGYERVK